MTPRDVIIIFINNPRNFPAPGSFERSRYWKCSLCRETFSFNTETHRPAQCRCGSHYFEKMVPA
ncbi:MAG: hypothetical protein JW864_06140 [Spirochaetes bacterium]|nr:hypothetical protein [Spirochaetota bacterium]